MLIRSTTDPVSLNEIPVLKGHPFIYKGSKYHGVLVYFENEENKRRHLEDELKGNK